MRLAVIGLMLSAAPALAAESPALRTAHTVATLVSDTDKVAPGTPYRVGLRLQMAPGWHTYWRNPGDGGVAPDLSFALPPGVTAGPVQWPAPAIDHEGPLTVFTYAGDLLLPVSVTGAGPVRLHAEWLVCAKICVPEAGDFALDLQAGAPAPSPQAGLFAAAERGMPRPSPHPAFIAPDGTLAVPGLAEARAAWFAAEMPDMIEATQPPAQTGRGVTLKLKPGPAFKPGRTLAGVLTVRDAAGAETPLRIEATPGTPPPSLGAVTPADDDGEGGGGLPRLLGLALLGGLILNLMPCVFPVLAFKAVKLTMLAGARRRTGAMLAASYTAGVLVAFATLGTALLAVRAAGGVVGWGFQFQSPPFVAVTAWVLFGVGLNLSGVYAISAGRAAGAGTSLCARKGAVGTFFTGLLAVVVATPCTAPFMGAAVAGALAAPAPAALAVFLAMGLGLAAPYAVLALVPGVARALPRPGAWMDVFKQALAFPMYAGALWLLWVVSQEAGPDGVLATGGGLLLFGLAAWSLGLAQRGAGRGRRIGLGVAAAAALGALALTPGMDGAAKPALAAADGAEPFSTARLAALQADGRPVFVDMTAAWCVTCLVNERVALAPEPVRRAFSERRVAYLKGDWTRQDPDITAFLRSHHRDGVPLYVFYPGGGAPPTVLPQILTQAIVLDAIGRTPG